jgi:hypothetical protein
MNALNFSLLLAVAFLAVFLQSAVTALRNGLGAQVDLLPALVAYAAMTGNVTIIATLAVCGGLWFDSLSANPLGLSVVPLFALGLLVHYRRELILRDQRYAQFWVGFAVSLAAPLLALLMLYTLGQNPLTGWATLWQLLVMALGGGVATPGFFWLFDRLDRALSFQALPESAYRPDREIKRGRN